MWGRPPPPPPSLLCFTSDCPFCPSGSTRTARATRAPSEYLPWWWHGIALLAAVMLAGLGGCSLGAHCVSLLAAGPLAARTTCKCLWGRGTLPQLGSVHPQMGGLGLSPSPSLNVSPLCKGLPGQVGLPGEIGVPGPKVRGQEGVLPAPASASHRLLDQQGKPHRVCGHPYSREGCATAAGSLHAAPHPMAGGCLHSQGDPVPRCPSLCQLWQLLNPLSLGLFSPRVILDPMAHGVPQVPQENP